MRTCPLCRQVKRPYRDARRIYVDDPETPCPTRLILTGDPVSGPATASTSRSSDDRADDANIELLLGRLDDICRQKESSDLATVTAQEMSRSIYGLFVAEKERADELAADRAESQREIDLLRTHCEELAAQFQSALQTINRLENTIHGTSNAGSNSTRDEGVELEISAIERLTGKLELKKSRIRRLQAEKSQLEFDLGDRQDQIERLESKLERKRHRVVQQHNMIANIQAALEDRDTQIQLLQQELVRKTRKLDLQRDKSKELRHEIRNQQRELSMLKGPP
ncbi:hypothetical protein FISHEDRAFT_68930 [Fistulina hepatica ATCC 64428]|uniref:Uncharacterized protein n=1 Tax=Fistulina hepatica ATCC 64428 TaxID=1128425 RepID=A0A0D7APF1_9AGAR|nr:hypothetical protein FISHEDRAFT_68930 [Fistulina hepatica ATCC 64428]